MKRVDDVAAHHLEPAPRIAHAVAKASRSDRIGDARHHEPEPRILPSLPHADHEIGALERGEHGGDVRGHVLPVAVERHDDATASEAQADEERGRLAVIPPEPDDATLRPIQRGPLGDRPRAVAAAVVDEQHFVRAVQRREHAPQLRHERRDVVGLVVQWHDDGPPHPRFGAGRRLPRGACARGGRVAGHAQAVCVTVPA
jgi:hypothetical protein